MLGPVALISNSRLFCQAAAGDAVGQSRNQALSHHRQPSGALLLASCSQVGPSSFAKRLTEHSPLRGESQVPAPYVSVPAGKNSVIFNRASRRRVTPEAIAVLLMAHNKRGQGQIQGLLTGTSNEHPIPPLLVRCTSGRSARSARNVGDWNAADIIRLDDSSREC